jgi:hypothetical protein
MALEQDIKGDLDEAAVAHYSIHVETRNFKLSPAQREAIHNMFMQMLMQTRIKMQLVLADDPSSVKVYADLRTPCSGKRELHLPGEDTDDN